MRNKILVIILTLLFAIPLFGQVDRSKRPEPGPAPEIQLSDYESFELENGLKVFVVENHKLPRVTYRLIIDRDPILEGDSAGYVSIAGSLLRTGTESKTKAEIDEAIDFIGASLSTSSSSIYASSLKQHNEKLLSIMSDIVLNSKFRKEQFDKLLKQNKSGLAAQKENPNAIASNVRRALTYGKDHPYGEVMTEETLKNVTLDKCEDYYDTYFRPNIAYLAIVGNITKDEAEPLIKKYFGEWKSKEVPSHNYDDPEPPLINKVALVDREASVQSIVNLAYPIDLQLGDEDVIPSKVLNTILGGYFSSRFNMNLREDKGFTYGARSTIATDELVGRFGANCETRNSATDSAITEFINEMESVRKEKVSEEELNSAKKYLIGSFARSLESPQTIAQFALNIERFNLPKDYYKDYLKKVNDVTLEDIQNTAKKYIKPENTHIIVVSNADDVADDLKKFSLSGKINYYDRYGNKYDPSMKEIPEGMTAQKVIDNYVEAIGGLKAVKNINDKTMTLQGSVQGNQLSLTVKQKAPNLYYQNLDAGMFKQTAVFDGEQGYRSTNGQKQMIEGEELETFKFQADMYPFLNYDKYGIEAELTGMEEVDGEEAYKVKLSLPNGDQPVRYYSKESGLLLKQVIPITTPQGTSKQVTKFSNYKEVGGVKFAHTVTQQMGPQGITMEVTELKVNTGLKDSFFEVEENK